MGQVLRHAERLGSPGLRGLLLACPSCRAGLDWEEEAARCRGCAASFPVVEGIPMLAAGDGSAAGEAKRRQAHFFAGGDAEHEIERPHGTPAFHAWLLAEKFRRSVAGIRPLLSGATALTVCGGSGMDAELLARAGARVITSDLSLGAARRAAERARRHGIPLTPIVADVERLPFPDGSVDLVYVHDGLHHLERPLAGLAEMARVAGLAVSITEPARAAATAVAVRLGLALEYEEPGNRVARLTLDELAAELEARGFRVVAAERYAMRYGHAPGRTSRLLSRRGLFPLARAGLRAGNALAGRAGNKLTVQAVRDGELP